MSFHFIGVNIGTSNITLNKDYTVTLKENMSLLFPERVKNLQLSPPWIKWVMFMFHHHQPVYEVCELSPKRGVRARE